MRKEGWGLFEIIFQGYKIQNTVQSRSTLKYIYVAHKFDWPLMGPSKVGKVFLAFNGTFTKFIFIVHGKNGLL